MPTRRGFLGSLLALPALAPFVGKVIEPVVSPEGISMDPAARTAASRVVVRSSILPSEAAPFHALLCRKQIREVHGATFEMRDGEENHCQIFRHPFSGVELTRRGTRKRELAAEEIRWHLNEHFTDIDYALLFGKRYIREDRGRRQTFMGGMEFFRAPSVALRGMDPIAWIVSHPETMKWGRGGTHAGSGTKHLLLSPEKASAMAASRGLAAINEYKGEWGRVIPIPVPALRYHSGTQHERAFLVDIEELRLVAMRGRNTRLVVSDHEDTAEYISDVSLNIENPEAHTVFSLV